MTLIEFINRTLVENNLTYKSTDVEKYINEKAKQYLDNKNGAIDDETIKNWIINYKSEEKAEDKVEDKPVESPHKIVKSTWEMESLL